MADMTDRDRGVSAEARGTERGASQPVVPRQSTRSRRAAEATKGALEAIDRFNPESVEQGREYGGTLYRLPSSERVRYVAPPNVQAANTTGGHVSTTQVLPAGAIPVGRWHTHGKTQNYTDEDFSDTDLRLVRDRGLPSWLGTPKGAVKVAVPMKSGIAILDVRTAEGTRPNIRRADF